MKNDETYNEGKACAAAAAVIMLSAEHVRRESVKTLMDALSEASTRIKSDAKEEWDAQGVKLSLISQSPDAATLAPSAAPTMESGSNTVIFGAMVVPSNLHKMVS